MRKIKMFLIFVLSVLFLSGCNTPSIKDNKYKLEVIDNWNLIVHHLEEEYEAGTNIEVHLHFRSGPSIGIKVNDEILIAKDYSMECEEGCQKVNFNMPDEDTTIYTHQNGEIIQSCGKANHIWDDGVESQDGVIVYTCTVCGRKEHNIEDHSEHTIEYTPGGIEGHYTTYTCGCPSTEGTTPHYDNNNDNICDVCGYIYSLNDCLQTIYIISHIANQFDSIAPSSITLDKENNTFTYFFDVISSYIGYGNYEYKDGYLFLESKIDEQTWVFKVVDRALVFDLSLSDGHLWFIDIPNDYVLTYFSIDVDEEEKVRTIYKINNELRPMPTNDKIYTSYEKEFGFATTFMLSGDAEVVWSETIEDVKFYYYDSGRIYVYYNGLIFTLTESYEKGILTIDDLNKLLKIYESEDNHYHDYVDGLCACGEFDEIWLNENFDLSDKKYIFGGSEEDDFNCDLIILTLKHTTTYIELSKRHFKIEGITKVEYVGGPRPPEYFFEEAYKHLLDNYQQIVFLHVESKSKSEIIELIKQLEQLAFVSSASPNSIESPDV